MKLADYLTQEQISDAEFGDLIGVTRQAVHRYKSDAQRPKWSIIDRIHAATGGAVSAVDFLKTETSGAADVSTSVA